MFYCVHYIWEKSYASSSKKHESDHSRSVFMSLDLSLKDFFGSTMIIISKVSTCGLCTPVKTAYNGNANTNVNAYT